MKREEIQKRVEEYLAHAQEGLEIENPKIDFKAKWYNLKDKLGEAEFVKDTTSIANTIGLDGFIIIGFDDEKKAFTQSTFKIDSGLKDTDELSKIIIKRCSNLFDIALYEFVIISNKVSVLHIPPTLEKPIVIKNHITKRREEQQRIFVRKGTSTFPASKYDIEMMFYDRKNVEPKYQYDISLMTVSIRESSVGKKQFFKIINTIDLEVIFDNYGKRTIALKDASVFLKNENEAIAFVVDKAIVLRKQLHTNLNGSVFCVIAKDNIVDLCFTFKESEAQRILKLEEFNQIELILTFSNGTKVSEVYNLWSKAL